MTRWSPSWRAWPKRSRSAALSRAARLLARWSTASPSDLSVRRLIVHESVYDALVPKLARVAEAIAVGSPVEGSALVGPLVDGNAFRSERAPADRARERL